MVQPALDRYWKHGYPPEQLVGRLAVNRHGPFQRLCDLQELYGIDANCALRYLGYWV